MKARLNKRERRAAQLLAHYETCERLAIACGMDPAKVDGKKISVGLLKLERLANAGATKYCNGEIEGTTWETMKGRMIEMVGETLGAVPPAFFINGDPRGYALKIDNEQPEGKALIEAVKLQTDWGGYGILSPEITGD